HASQILARSFTQKRTLGEVLVGSDALVGEVLAGLRESEAVRMLGVEVLELLIIGIKATPEMATALQTDAHERLLKLQDEAIDARRNAAVELEGRIKENELNSEIAVEQKKRQVRESQMAAEIAVEQQRATLVDAKVENDRKETETRAAALAAMLEPVKSVDLRTLMAASSGRPSATPLPHASP